MSKDTCPHVLSVDVLAVAVDEETSVTTDGTKDRSTWLPQKCLMM